MITNQSFPTRPRASWTKALCLLLMASSAGISQADQAPEWLLGEWLLDSQRTHDLQPKQKSGGGGGGFNMPSVSVGGVYVPLPGTASNAGGSGNARDPRVLRCETMTVALQGENVHFLYPGVGEEVMKPGNDQGRKTTWRRNKLTQSYETTSRTVSKTYELQKDGTLLVKVKINPKGSKAATHVRVFQPAVTPTG